MAQRCISVIGAARAEPPLVALAGEVGAAIARAGLSLVCGGLGGVMEAACDGFRRARDLGEAPPSVRSIGILPGDDGGRANAHVDFALPTGLGFARNVLVVLGGHAAIAVGGGSGTLSEIALAWQHGRPIAVLGGAGGLYDELGLGGRRLDYRHERPIFGAVTAAEAVSWCVREMGPAAGAPPA